MYVYIKENKDIVSATKLRSLSQYFIATFYSALTKYIKYTL